MLTVLATLTQALPAEDFVWATPPGCLMAHAARIRCWVCSSPARSPPAVPRAPGASRWTESTVHLPVFAPLMAPMLAAGVAIVDSAATTVDALRRALDAAELTRAAPDTGTVRLPATNGAV